MEGFFVCLFVLSSLYVCMCERETERERERHCVTTRRDWMPLLLKSDQKSHPDLLQGQEDHQPYKMVLKERWETKLFLWILKNKITTKEGPWWLTGLKF